MIQFYLLGFPVQIQPFFWLSCLLLGGGLSASKEQDFINLLSWTLVVFISIIVHELGHAFAGRHFGAKPAIALHGLGGLTFLPGANFTRSQSILVSGSGPVASLLLLLVFFGGAILAGKNAPYDILKFIQYGLSINFGWTLFNLLPIQPLDGGQIFRDILGPSRFKITCWVGAILAAALTVWAILNMQIFIALLGGVLAWSNFKGRNNIAGGVQK